MKALVLNGTEEDEASKTVYKIMTEELENSGLMVDMLILRDMEIASCLGCFGCWIKSPGICVIDDAGRDVAKKIIQSDLVIFFTPVTFGGYSSELKKAVDRLVQNISPFFAKINGEVHHKPRYEKYPSLLGLGMLPEPDEECERLFKTLVRRNAINMYSPASTGGVVFNNQSSEKMRGEISRLLSEVGIKK